VAAIQQRDWRTAVDANRVALQFDPRSADACNNLGWALAQLGRREDAARAYEQALALRPGDERAVNNLRLLR
jgi:Flp pilus assembly protein TadD